MDRRPKEKIERYLLNVRLVFEQLDESELGRLGALVADAPRLFVAGLGRSGAMMRAFATRLGQLGRVAHMVFDAGAPAIGRDDLLLIGSGSGSTRTMVAVADEARERSARLVVITANALSPLGRDADFRLVLPPVLPPGTVAGDSLLEPLQTLFEQSLLLALDAVAEAFLEPRHTGGERAGGEVG